jgi:hypothetical protein
VVLFIGGALMAFIHARFLIIFVPFFTPIFADLLKRWVPGYDREKDHYVLNALLMAAMLIGMIHYFPSPEQTDRNVAASFPVRAVAYLNDHPAAGAMFNSYNFGGYLVYSRGDKHKVFIDGRGELYEHAGVFADYLHVIMIEPGLQGVLRNYQIGTCLVQKNDPIAVFLGALPEWKQVYTDEMSVIFIRSDLSVNAAL